MRAAAPRREPACEESEQSSSFASLARLRPAVTFTHGFLLTPLRSFVRVTARPTATLLLLTLACHPPSAGAPAQPSHDTIRHALRFGYSGCRLEQGSCHDGDRDGGCLFVTMMTRRLHRQYSLLPTPLYYTSRTRSATLTQPSSLTGCGPQCERVAQNRPLHTQASQRSIGEIARMFAAQTHTRRAGRFLAS